MKRSRQFLANKDHVVKEEIRLSEKKGKGNKMKESNCLLISFPRKLRSLHLIRVTVSLVAPGIRCCRPSRGVHQFFHSHTRTWTTGRLMWASCPAKWPSLRSPQHQAIIPLSDLVSRKYTLIYAFPAIRVLRALSRLKLAQTGITSALLPTVYYFYLQGQASFSLLTYTTGIAVFAAIMLYTISYYVQRVVGMMYLDPTHTTLKVAHLSFWGHRRDIHLPISDIMTLGDTGDSPGEVILRLKRYSCPDTLYFSTRLGRVLDKNGFEKVFGTLS
ncbi:transmembrane protein 186 isoform X1 [Neoarius graeffei]|uniref:transmembrane protein 186 isoform X1 n=1 Tax=Neoarius graeffei TaxID=443677 RepID=UPI00298CC45B|nr:transmembrane protein 186 isoform X1 [Neoarius graeffei]